MLPLLLLVPLSVPAPARQEVDPAELPLLPELPEDWRHERLEFPLDFAPGLALEGVELLGFAPGMFSAGERDFWTYLLALDVTGPEGAPLEVDAAWLEGFLTEYYRGLCAAVGESRDVRVARERITAEVTGGGQDYVATVELIDAFVTGRPLSLRIELLLHPDPTGGAGLELLGLASPAPVTSGVWLELRELGAAWRAARPVPVLLNHVYMVPDLETYEALRDSELLRSFAVVEERTTRRGDLTYTGLYLYGQRTYLEFLKPDAAAGFPAGSTGVAFGVEVEGGLERLAAALEDEGVPSFAAPITRSLTGAPGQGGEPEQVPWFDILGFQAATTEQRLQLFAMEYDPAFLARFHAPDGHLAGRIDRAAVLARYAEVLGGPEAPMLRDVTHVSLDLTPEEARRWLEVARALGMGNEHDAGFHLDTDRVLEIRTGAGHGLATGRSRELPGGVLLVQGTLQNPPPPGTASELRLGQVLLQLGDERFTLLFEGLPTESDE